MKSSSIDTSFRPDVEGLRALAVFAVILFHYSNGRTAGFVGVDVFFVISGFLITRLIVRDLERGTFSFITFYARRARRIIPALFVMVLATLAAGYILLSPEALARLGLQAATSLFGGSNIYFWATSGYFSPEAHSQPLLHTWSLGVEEQFYLLWPLLLLCIFKAFGVRTRTAVTTVGVLIVASFASVLLVDEENTSFSFFMLPTRAWQLAIGGLLVVVPRLEGRSTSEALKLIGLVLLLSGIVLIDPDAAYPGVSALLPTVGTALVIWPAKRRTLVAGFFSAAPLRYFGRISYSLYLWHWPPMVMFLTWSLNKSLSLPQSAILFLFAWGASHLSWRFVEEPFRHYRFSDGKTLMASAFVVCLAATASWTLFATGGVPTRLAAAGQELSTRMHRETNEAAPVHCDLRLLLDDETTCAPLRPDEQNVLVMGDSHAVHLFAAIQETFPSVRLSRLTRSGCRPVLGSRGRKGCVEMYERFFEDVLPEYRFDTIIVSARWRNGEYQNIGETVDLLREHSDRVIVLGQTVEYDHPLPELLMSSYLPRRSSDIKSFMSTWPEVVEVDADMKQQLSARPVEYYSVKDAICPDDDCTVLTPSGMPLVWDYGHFNASGAKLVVDRLQAGGFSLP